MNESRIAVVEKALVEESKLLVAIETRMKLDARSRANLQENIAKGTNLLTRLQEEAKKSEEVANVQLPEET